MARQFAFLSQSVHWSSELAVGVLSNGEGTQEKQRYCGVLFWRWIALETERLQGILEKSIQELCVTGW